MPGVEPSERWDGERREVCGAGGQASSGSIGLAIGVRLLATVNQAGSVARANGGCILSRGPDTVLVPDVAFVRWERRCAA